MDFSIVKAHFFSFVKGMYFVGCVTILFSNILFGDINIHLSLLESVISLVAKY